jgi:CO/xanthine dehydrogenase FAD-binding subunit
MIILHDFDYRRPQTMDDALALLSEHGDRASPLAGGTDLVVNMKYRSILQLVEGAGSDQARFPAAQRVRPMARPDLVVSLADLSELGGVKEAKDMLRIGPMTTMAQFAEWPDIPPAAGALRDAAGVMGSPLIRNRATIGGNLINARPAADTAVAILALGGRLELASAEGRRWVEIASFFTGPGTCVRRPDELLVSIELPCSPAAGSAYVRQGTRRQLEIALVGAASWVELDSATGRVAAARIALGAVAPTPILALQAAGSLVGQKPGPEAWAAAASTASSTAAPSGWTPPTRPPAAPSTSTTCSGPACCTPPSCKAPWRTAACTGWIPVGPRRCPAWCRS